MQDPTADSIQEDVTSRDELIETQDRGTTWVKDEMDLSFVDEIVAYARRSATRIEQITVTTRFDDDLPLLMKSLEAAREQRWTG